MRNHNAIPKTISYRIYSFIILLTLTYLITGSIAEALKFSWLVEIVKTLQYLIFEKLWHKKFC